MRGPVLDTRPTGIESITPYWIRTSDEEYDPILATVPKPVVDVNSFYREEPLAKTTTTVFVGEYIYRESQYSAGQGTISIPGTYQYIKGETTPSWGPAAGGTPYRVLTGNVVGVARTDLGPADALVLGAATNATNVNNTTSWAGPFRALVFDTELSPEQITAVTNWLMAGHYLDAPGTPIGVPELPTGNLNGAGRNLLRFTGDMPIAWDKISQWNNTKPFIHTGQGVRQTYDAQPNSFRAPVNPLTFKPSTDYTVSFMLRGIGTNTGSYHIIKRENQAFKASDVTINTTSFTKIQSTFRTSADVDYSSATAFMTIYVTEKTAQWYEIACESWKLEEGTKATAWTPAPEDDYDYWQPTRPTTEPDTSIWRTYLEVRDDGTYRYRIPTRIA